MNNCLPFELQDEERIRVLMGPMPSAKDSVAFNSRITFWTATLYNWCKSKSGLSFTLQDGEMAFRRGTQVPLCLPYIYEHLIKKGEMITVDDLVKHVNENESWLTWSKKLVVTPSLWALSFINDTMKGKGFGSRIFVHTKVLEEIGEELLRIYWSMPLIDLPFDPEGVITVENLYQHINKSIPISLEDLNLVLHFLAKRYKIAIQDHLGRSLVKVVKPGQTEPLLISDMEIAEYELQVTQDKLKERIHALQQELKTFRGEAKKSLNSGSKNEAMSWLRRKKRCEKSIEVTLLGLENISQCVNQIQDSKLNVKILTSFQFGVNALKSSLKESGGLDQVAKELDSVQEVLDECRDITDTMAFGIQSPSDYNETDLDQELRELLKLESPVQSPPSLNADLSNEMTLPAIPKNDPLENYLTKEITMSL